MTLPSDFPAPPRYGERSVADVMSSAAAALGVPGTTNTVGLPKAQRYVVVLVDGLGAELLSECSGYAPTLRKAQSLGALDAAFPTTTSVSLSSLGTGLAPGQHGMLGYDVVDPQQDRVVNMLGQWSPRIKPETWQPHRTVFNRSEATVDTVTVSKPRFQNSELTRASLRGGRFKGADGVFARTAAVLEELREGKRALVYFYWDELDKVGHAKGWRSDAWLTALEELDSAIKRLVQKLPSNTRVVLTADHGMVDVAAQDRVDASAVPGLLHGVRHTAGEPRAVQLHTQPDTDPALVAARWQEHYGDTVWAVTREDLAAGGYFGPDPDPVMLERAGHVWVLGKEPVAIYDVSRQGTKPLNMVGQHGSLTPAERLIPALVW